MRRPSFCLDVSFGLSKLASQLRKDEMAGAFLLACNFTDARLLGLNSLRFSRLRIDRGWAYPYSPSLKRPCHGTSGLVRGNRRKAVFAFKGYLLRWFLIALSALRRLVLSRIPEVLGKIENLRAQPDYLQQNRRSRKSKTGVWSADLGFTPHFRKRLPEVCGKFRNPRAHRLFK